MSAHKTSISRRWAAELERDRIYRALRDKREHDAYLAQLARERASDVLDGAVSLNDVTPLSVQFEERSLSAQDDEFAENLEHDQRKTRHSYSSLTVRVVDRDELEKMPRYSGGR